MTDEKNMDVPDENEASQEQNEAVQAADVEVDAAAEEAAEATPEEAESENMEELSGEAASEDELKVVNEGDVGEEDAEAAMMKMLEGLPNDESSASLDDINFGSASVSRAEFQHLQDPAGSNEPRNIDLLMDVDLPISIELGRTKMSISDILALGPGSVVELNKLAGEPVDLLVNYKVVARGEVVVVDENFGLRVTQLMTPEERLKSLAEE